MLVPMKLRGLDTGTFHQKVSERLGILEKAFPDYSKRYAQLARERLSYYLGYQISEMKVIYEKWSGKTDEEPSDYFPVYCRLRWVLGEIDLSYKDITFVDCKRHMFWGDLEYLCQADVSEVLPVQKALDFLGLDMEVVDDRW